MQDYKRGINKNQWLWGGITDMTSLWSGPIRWRMPLFSSSVFILLLLSSFIPQNALTWPAAGTNNLPWSLCRLCIYFHSCPLRPYFIEKRSSLFNFHKSSFQIKLNHGELDQSRHLHQSTLILPSPLLSFDFPSIRCLFLQTCLIQKTQTFFLPFNTRAALRGQSTRKSS